MHDLLTQGNGAQCTVLLSLLECWGTFAHCHGPKIGIPSNTYYTTPHGAQKNQQPKTNFAAGIPRQWAELGLEPQLSTTWKASLDEDATSAMHYFDAGGRRGCGSVMHCRAADRITPHLEGHICPNLRQLSIPAAYSCLKL